MNGQVAAEVAAALNRWSLGVQLAVVVVLAVVFYALWLSSRREVVLTWLLAWAADLGALTAVLVYSLTFQNLPSAARLAFYLGYSALKITFAALLLVGLEQFRRSSWAMGARIRRRCGLIVLGAFLIGFLIRPDFVILQAVVCWVVGLLTCLGGALLLLRGGGRGTRLLPAAFLIESAVFFQHAIALSPSFRGGRVPVYMSYSSFVDAGTELALGLVLLLALGNTALDEMARTNARLEGVQRSLRELVDADPLTGLYNRRRLRQFVVANTDRQGVVVYVDVDWFKAVNDRWGHATGDACLVRVADGLRAVFRSGDGLFRMGGDEFLVVAPGLAPHDAADRIATLREILSRAHEGQPPLSISVGVSVFGGETSMDQALAAADAVMYGEKARR